MTIHIYSLERKPLHCKGAVISMKAINHEGTDLLVNAILSLKNTQECTAFLQDLLTISELQSMAQRIYPECQLCYLKGQSEKQWIYQPLINDLFRTYQNGSAR